jgi:hypothetical protein
LESTAWRVSANGWPRAAMIADKLGFLIRYIFWKLVAAAPGALGFDNRGATFVANGRAARIDLDPTVRSETFGMTSKGLCRAVRAAVA